MEDPKKAEIKALKLQWRKLSAAHRKQEKLIQMLEEVETYLMRLENELDGSQSPHEEEKRELYKQLSQKKHELDQLLDEVEEITAEDVEEAQEEMVARLLEYEPHLAQAYGTLHQAMLQAQERERKYHQMLTGLGSLRGHIKGIVENRKGALGWRGLLRYIFGPSPTARITREIEAMRSVAKQLLDQDSSDEEVTLLLQQLVGLSNQRWDFKLIDKHYTPLCESVIMLEKQYQQALHVARKEKLRVTVELTEWVEQA